MADNEMKKLGYEISGYVVKAFGGPEGEESLNFETLDLANDWISDAMSNPKSYGFFRCELYEVWREPKKVWFSEKLMLIASRAAKTKEEK